MSNFTSSPFGPLGGESCPHFAPFLGEIHSLGFVTSFDDIYLCLLKEGSTANKTRLDSTLSPPLQ